MKFDVQRICTLILLVTAHASAEDYPDTKKNTRMAHGKKATIQNYPYMVQIIYKGKLQCGGAIIDKKFILTSASCFAATNITDASKFKIYAGDNRLYKGQMVKVKKITPHESYVGLNYFAFADIALVELESKLKLSHTIKPIAVNHYNHTDDSSYKSCRMAGWGASDDLEETSDGLQWVKLKPITFQKCKDRYPGLFQSNICAQGYEKGASCHRDLGGPMVCDQVMIGILNALVVDCSTKAPEIFTKTAYYKDWIRSKLHRHKRIIANAKVEE